MDLKRDDLAFIKDECWKESEKRFLQKEWRDSKESFESILSSSSLINSIFSKSSKVSKEEINDEFSVIIDDDFPVNGELFFQFSNISIINRVFCDISSVKYTTYSEVRPIFYFLSFFFFFLSLLLIERSWNCVTQIKIDYDNFNEIPILSKNNYKKHSDSSQREVLLDNNTIHEFTLDRTLYDPIFVYYGVNGFFSNTKEFVSSKPPELFGYGYKCTHILTIEDILRYRPDIKNYLSEFFKVPRNFNFNYIDKIFSTKNKRSKIFKVAKNNSMTNILCGLPIYSLFTDEIELTKKGSNESIFIKRNMDFPEDQWKYKLLHNFRQYVTATIEKSSLLNGYDTKKLRNKDTIPRLSIMLSRWWNQSISPNFIKPYGIITSSYEYNQIDDFVMYPGTYELNVTSNNFPNYAWGAEKYILLTNLSIFGGEQYLAATLCLLISMIYALIIYFDPKRAQMIIINHKIDQKPH